MNAKMKRRVFGAFGILTTVAVAAGLFQACDEVGVTEHGLDEDFFASVRGQLQIETKVPEQTDEILLALMDGLNPRFTKTIPRRDLNGNADSQVIDFVMEAQTGEFDALFVIWKALGTPLSVIENIVGSHCEDGELIPITITEQDRTVDSVGVEVNLRKVDRRARVSGVIRFQGEWPDNVDNLGLVFADPNALLQGLNVCTLLKAMDIRLLPETPVDSLVFDYEIAAGPTLMVVAWNQVGQSLFEPTIISNPLQGAFEAVADSTITDFELVANFGN